MAHGSFKPTRKHMNDVLRSKRNGPHDACLGKHVKRAKIMQTLEREAKRERNEY